MKTIIVSAYVILAAVRPLFGDPPAEQELARLTEQHDKALAAATDPINQLYRSALDQLLQKANESNDTELAAKIKDAITRIQSGAKPQKGKPATAEELTAYLAGTVWSISDERPDGKVLYTLTFLKGGTMIHSNGKTGAWSAQSARDLKLWNWDPATLNEDLTQFRGVGTGVIYFGNLKKK